MSQILAHALSFDHGSVEKGGRRKVHAVLDLEGLARGVDAKRPPLSIAFAVDVSGSMQGEPIEHVISSLAKLIDFLDDDDQVGLAVFSDEASVVSEVRPLTKDHRAALKGRARRLNTIARTNIEAGLAKARASLPARQPDERQLVMLLTDGVPNVGRCSSEELRALAESFRPEVAVTTLGYGAHHHEDLLVEIARGGGGEYVFIHDPVECEFELARAVGSQGEVVADNVALTLQLADGVELTDQYTGRQPRFSGAGLKLALPDLFEGQRRAVVLELSVDAPAEVGPMRVGALVLSYRPAGEAAAREVEIELRLPVTSAAGALDAEVNAKVLLGRTDRVRAEARAQADRGNFDAAAAQLRAFMKEIEAAPSYVAGDGSALSEAYEQLVDEALAYETRPSQEQYRNFRRSFYGVEAATGAQHGSDRKATSLKSAALMQKVIGEVPKGVVVVENTKTGEVSRVPLQGELTIGRVQGNDIVLSTGMLSKRHTRLVVREGKLIVVDLRSTNGTYLNGKRVVAPQVLGEKDVVQLGDFALRVEYDDAEDEPG